MTATAAGTTMFGTGLVSAFVISRRLSSARVGGRCISPAISCSPRGPSEERRDALVHRLDVVGVARVLLTARRRGDVLQRLLGAARALAVGDREHPHARLRVAAVERLLDGVESA